MSHHTVGTAATNTTETAPVDTETHDGVPEGQNTTTAAPVPTTTEVRGVTHRLANLDVANPEAPPAAATTAAAGTSAQNTTAPIANLPAQEITLAVQSAATAAAAGVREDFIAALREMTQVSSTAAPRRTDTLSVRDLRLPEFKGSKKDSSNYIEPDFYLPLLSWTREVRALLVVSGLSARQQTLSIIKI